MRAAGMASIGAGLLGLVGSGIAMGATVSLTVDGGRFAQGEAVYYWLSYTNDGSRDEYVARPAINDPNSFEPIAPEGERLASRGEIYCFSPSPRATYFRVQPGETVVASGNLAEQFDLSAIGTYRLRLNYSNGQPESFMLAWRHYPGGAEAAEQIDRSLIVKGPVTSPEVTFAIELGEMELEGPNGQGTQGAVSAYDALVRRRETILAKHPDSAYAPHAVSAQVQLLLARLDRPSLSQRRRFALAADMIEDLEKRFPKWHGFPYLYSRAAAAAVAKGEGAYAEAWASRLRSRYPDHPALIWLANRRAELAERPPAR